MLNDKNNQYISILKWISNIAQGAGIFVPGYSYFTLYAPPMFPGASVLTSALAVAVIVYVYYYYQPGAKHARCIRLSFLATFVMLTVYILLLQFFTVVDPQGKTRFQIGFRSADWSLTERGLQWKKEHPSQTIEDWMLSHAAYRPGGPELIWKQWTIYFLSALTIIIFMSTFVLWTKSFALLAKRKSIEDE